MINYDCSKMRIRQRIGTISLYEFEGTFDAVIKKLEEERKHYTDNYVLKAKSVPSYNDYHKYLDGEKTKLVQFDKLGIDIGEDYGDKVYEVWGERDFLPEELAAYAAKKSKQADVKKERDKQEYERLKKEFEGK